MKTYYITPNGCVGIDGDSDKVFPINSERLAIDRVFLIEEEDTKFVYSDGVETMELYPQVGDIVVKFWDRDFKNKIVVVSSALWSENLKLYKQMEQEEKERWAKSKSPIEDAAANSESEIPNDEY